MIFYSVSNIIEVNYGRREDMEERVWSVKALAVLMNTTLTGLAEMCDMKSQHLKEISCGKIKMSAKDLLKLSEVTGIPCESIEVRK